MSSSAAAPTVLAVAAHPGDIEFLCGGTLALLRERGWQVVLATVTAGDPQVVKLSAEEMDRVCVAEARNAAAVLDATYHCLQPTDHEIFFTNAPCRQAAGLLREVRPRIVMTHSALDRLPDHGETARIVRQACSSAPNAGYKIKGSRAAPLDDVPYLYYFDPVGGTDFLGHPIRTPLIVDISGVFETKQRMLAAHEAARDGAREPHGAAFADEMRTWAERRGREAGCALGEGFCQHREGEFPTNDLLREALGELVKAVNDRQETLD